MDIVFTLFLIFSGAAVLATLALYARQALIVAYIALGILFGPSGLDLLGDPELVRQISDIGILFLLFLLGLNLAPQKLLHLVSETLLVTGISSALFAGVGYGITLLMGFSQVDAVFVGVAMMFSSTIIGLKLLPTTVLHHQHTGEIIISVLLLQDIIAIFVLLFLKSRSGVDATAMSVVYVLLSLPALILFAYVMERFVLNKLLGRFDKIQEYMFLLALGWCLGMAEAANYLGLTPEIGAFVAGIAMASHPISLFITENLKPLRDFFLVIFFFSLGASFELTTLADVLLPAMILAVVLLLFKPLVFGFLLRKSGEKNKVSTEVGVRMGQVSEFSLLIAVMALDFGVISQKASYLIQLTTLITFIISTFVIVRTYPNPIALRDDLRRD
jgi:Kef-type K+ transport system membrane component KefB